MVRPHPGRPLPAPRPIPTPESHVFHVGLYHQANPQGDVQAAIAHARKRGYNVIDRRSQQPLTNAGADLKGLLDSADKSPSSPSTEQPGALERYGKSLKEATGAPTSLEEAWNQLKELAHPFANTKASVRGALEAQGQLGKRAASEFQHAHYMPAVIHGVEYLIPIFGPGLAKAGDQFRSGDIAGGAGTMTGIAAPMVVEKAPGAMRAGVGAAERTVSGLRPTATTIGEEQIPVRASQQSRVPSAAETVAPKKPLQKFDVEQTQPAARRAASNIAAQSAGVAKPGSLPLEDAFGFGGAAEKLEERAQPVFQKLDELSGGEFSKAQSEARLYRRTTDAEGRTKYQQALDKQNAIFDQYKDQFPGIR